MIDAEMRVSSGLLLLLGELEDALGGPTHANVRGNLWTWPLRRKFLERSLEVPLDHTERTAQTRTEAAAETIRTFE